MDTGTLRRRVSLPDPALGLPELLAGMLYPARPEVALDATRAVAATGLARLREPQGAGLIAALGLAPAAGTRLRLCAELLGRADSEWALPPPIRTPRDVLPHVLDIRDAPGERVVAIYLDARNRPLKRELVAAGGLTASVVRPRDVLAPALALPAAGLVLVHNHPSGDCAPSRDDVEITRQLDAACGVLGLQLVDHVIVSRSGCVSIRELGVLASGSAGAL